MTPSSVEDPVPPAEPVLASALERAAAALEASGVRPCPLEGKLLRPTVAWALTAGADRPGPDDPFWSGALAIQMVHEASLLHDDILDDARERRSRQTVAAERGTGPALVLGDLYLTGAYRAALAVGFPGFLDAFITAVERTVAGEVAQERSAGRTLSPADYQAVIRGKSGELFGAAAVLAAARRDVALEDAREVGCRIGALYQMVDDFLDYCPEARTGKPAFQDYRQEKFTFVLEVAGVDGFGASVEEIHGGLAYRDSEGRCAMDRALERLVKLRSEVQAEVRRVFGADEEIAGILEDWVGAARRGLERSYGVAPGSVLSGEGAGTGSGGPSIGGRPSGVGGAPPLAGMAGEGLSPRDFVVAAAREVGDSAAWGDYFGTHSKSFRFSARLFPARPRRDVEGVYAFCRFTDELVDEARVPVAEARARLEAWRRMARAAYDGETLDIPLLDKVMGRLRASNSPFHYVDDLLTGVGMDLEPVEYATLEDLSTYTYRVASVVGGWITELFVLHDPALLKRAYAMGHAMQLTNILRDVGEDWRRGRLYLPLEVLERHGVSRVAVAGLADDGRVPPTWPALMEELMEVADRQYASAFQAIPLLPSFYRRPVAVAARVYQGIHDEIRRNGYDNGTRRAYTSLGRKLRLAAGGLWSLRRLPEPALELDAPALTLAHQDG